MSRDSDERDIANIYGLPGTDYDTERGREMLVEAVEHFGFAALTDEALAYLAEIHVMAAGGRRPRIMSDEEARRAMADLLMEEVRERAARGL